MSTQSGCDLCIDSLSVSCLQSKLLNLRAAVDHMSGPACTVRQVQEVATTEEPAARIERGMTTKLSKDRMVSPPVAMCCLVFLTTWYVL